MIQSGGAEAATRQDSSETILFYTHGWDEGKEEKHGGKKKIFSENFWSCVSVGCFLEGLHSSTLCMQEKKVE